MVETFQPHFLKNEKIRNVDKIENETIFRWSKPFSHISLPFSEQIVGLMEPPISKFFLIKRNGCIKKKDILKHVLV